MKDDSSCATARQRSTLNGDHHDAEYNETLSQVYDTVLASLDHQKSKSRPWVYGEGLLGDNAEPKNDNSSMSTASSDGTPGDEYETFEMLQSRRDEPTSFLGGTVKTSTMTIKKGIAVRLQRGWRALRGCEPIEVFLENARYPSEVRQPC